MITIVCGSPSKRSNTLKFAEEIARMTGMPYQVRTASDWQILPCRGCHQCFEKGHCIQNGKDDLEDLIADLRQSEGIIFASPVYAGSVTGQMKILIDRMSVLLHEMPLIGIPSIVLTTSSGNHLEETLVYLRRIMEWMGSSVVAEAAVKVGSGSSGMCRRYEKESCETVTEKAPEQVTEAAAGAFKRVMEDPALLPVSESLAWYFRHQNRRYRSLIPTLKFLPGLFGEAAVWEEQGYDRCETIREVIAMKYAKGNRKHE